MTPTILDGDWLLVDPTVTRWPRRGSIVVFREPDGGALAVKRVFGRPGDRVPFETGYLELADDEAWLLSDATSADAADAGLGEPIDSRRYGPVPVELLRGSGLVPLCALGPDRSAPWSEADDLDGHAGCGSGRGLGTQRQAGGLAVGGEGRLRLERRRPTGREAHDPVQADRRERGQSVHPFLAGVPHLLVPDVDREPHRRRIATLGLAARPDLGHALGDLGGRRGTRS